MNRKQLLRFYFSAEVLECAFNNLIMKYALSSFDFGRDTEYYAGKIISVIKTKNELSVLWRYLDKVMCGMTDGERKILYFYGKSRTGISSLSDERKKAVKRVTVKYMRRARSVGRYKTALALVKRYYCLM